MPDAGVLATILLIVGLFLLAVELMIPSFGIIGILAAITLLVSAWSAWQAWWGTSPGFFWTYAAFWLLGIPSVLGGVLFLLQNTSLGDRFVLRGPKHSHGESVTQVRNELEYLVGQTGSAASLLTPGGMVIVDGERFHAESPGMVIESGAPIRVTDVKGNRLVVRTCDAEDEHSVDTEPLPQSKLSGAIIAASEEAVEATSEGEENGILDFDIPEG